MCFNLIGNCLRKKPSFEEQCVRCLACFRGWDLNLGKTGVALLLQTRFLLSFMFLILFFLNVLRLRHLEKNVLLLFAPSLSTRKGFEFEFWFAKTQFVRKLLRVRQFWLQSHVCHSSLFPNFIQILSSP